MGLRQIKYEDKGHITALKGITCCENYLDYLVKWDIRKMEFEEDNLGSKQGGDLGSKETEKKELQ